MSCDPAKPSVPAASCCSTGKPEAGKAEGCSASRHEDGKTDCCPIKATAHRLVELCKAGQCDQAEEELYADHISSVEPFSCDGKCKTTVGKSAVKAKGVEWHKHMTVHSCSVEGPFPQPESHRFAVVFKMDCTCAQRGRMQMDEVALYTCESTGGKIIRAEFFYAPPGGGECADKHAGACADKKPGDKTGCDAKH